MRKPLFLLALLLSLITNIQAQYAENPLKERQWLNFSNGINTADHFSWQSALTYSKRSDVLMTSIRMGYSQELFESAKDSVTDMKNKIFEAGMMWGEGFGGEHWYVSATAGMGLNLRIYGDDDEDTKLTRSITGLTIGVPVQLEAGILFNDRWGMNSTILANWNFRQPYVGLHVGMVYRFKKKKS
ncbi:MAG: DUF2715 domain-containing protein [Flavobacteriales bacterium]